MPSSTWISMIPTSGSGNGSSSLSVETYTGREKRQGSVVGETDGGASDTSTVIQTGKPEFIKVTNTTYTAELKGSTVVIEGTSNSATLKLFQGPASIAGVSFSLVVNEKPDPSWNGITDFAIDGDPGATAEYKFKLSMIVPENQSVSRRSSVFALNNANTDVTSGDITVTQSAGVKTFSLPVISEFTYPTDIPASGGTSEPNIKYSQTWGWNGNLTNGGTIESGARVTYTGAKSDSITGVVKASSLGTTVKERSVVTTVSAVVSINGRDSAPLEAQCYQSANESTSGDITVIDGSVEDIPASGGQVESVTGISASQVVSFTSGSTRDGQVSISYDTPVSAPSLTTNVKSRTQVGILSATITGEGSITATRQYPVYQQANQVEVYGTIQLSATDSKSFSADGGNVSVETMVDASQQLTYTSGATQKYRDITIDSSQVIAQPGFSLSQNTVTVSPNVSALQRGDYKVLVTLSGLNKETATKILTFSQQAAGSTIRLNPSNLSFPSDGGTQQLTVTANDSWTLEIIELDD